LKSLTPTDMEVTETRSIIFEKNAWDLMKSIYLIQKVFQKDSG